MGMRASGGAPAGGGGVNPNVDVGGEGTVSTSAGGDIGFDDIEVIETPKKKPKDEDEKKPVESKVKDENKAPAKEKKEPEPKDGKAPEKKPAAEKEAKDGDDPAKPGRAKTFKGKHGETEVAVSGAAKFSVPSEDGKTTEEMTFQEIMNEMHGKRYYERTTKRIEAEHKARTKEAQAFDDTIKGFMETAQKDSDAGWDFLANLSGADPVKFKMDLLRKQIAEIIPLARMDEAELETWLKDKEREFSDKSLQRRKKELDDVDTKRKTTAEDQKLAQDFGLESDEWQDLADRVEAHKKAKGINTPVTARDIVTASRLIMADEAIKETVPHLAQHAEYGKIFDDIVSDLLRHPKLTRERLKATLKETFGAQDDNRGKRDLIATSEKIQRDERISGTRTQTRPIQGKNEHETFDDL